MFYRNASIFAFACAVGTAGCRDNGNVPPVDLSMNGGDMAGGGGGGGTGGGDMTVKNYSTSTITATRTAGAYGNFEFDNVVVLGVGPTGTRIYIQDPAGGDLSAIQGACPNTGTHMCTMQSTVKTAAAGHQVTLKGTYEKGGAMTGNFETFYIDSIMDNGAAPMSPPAKTVTMADIIKTSVSGRANWFQKVKVTLADALVMYDLSPPEFAHTGGTNGCPAMFGWGMVPMTGAPASPPPSCDASCAAKPAPATCTQPAAQTMANANEVLIATDFYGVFKASTDCKCYFGFTDTVVTGSQKVANGMTIQGVLVYDAPSGGTPRVYLAPTAPTDLPLQ